MATQTWEAKHQADRMPTDDEAEAAERSAKELQDSGEEEKAAEHYKEMASQPAAGSHVGDAVDNIEHIAVNIMQ